MKFHGLYEPAHAPRETFKPKDAAESDDMAQVPPTAQAMTSAPGGYSSPTKKPRKHKKGIEDNRCSLPVDDDEELIPMDAPAIKTESIAPTVVKEELQTGYDGMAGFQYPLEEVGGGRTGDDCTDLLSDFLQPGDFEPQNGSDGNAFNAMGHRFL